MKRQQNPIPNGTVDVLRGWRRHPDRYAEISNYLAARNLQRFTARSIILYLALIAAATYFLLASPFGPVSPAFPIAVGLFHLLLVLFWMAGWPTRTQSLAFVFCAIVASSCTSLAVADPRVGMVVCINFTSVVAFVAFFHTFGHLLVTIAIAFTTVGLCAFRYAVSDGVLVAVTLAGIVGMAILSVSNAVKVSVHVLSDLAYYSDTDELTGLLNRRSFMRVAEMLLDGSLASRPINFGVILIDLDKFKMINDVGGHLAGDRALIRVSQLLRQAAGRQDAIVARYGGEEFVLAFAGTRGELEMFADQLCREIAAAPERITASVGIASIDCAEVPPHRSSHLLADLIRDADRAMYAAKSRGGNQWQYHWGVPGE